MPYLYLDHNIYIYALKNSAVQQKILSLKDLGMQCVYSPAHIEEIHTALVGNSDENYIETAKNLFSLVSETTDNLECLPSALSSVVIKKEHPCKCYQRVKQMDTTTRVHNDSEYKFSVDKEHYRNMVKSDKHNTSISTLSCEEIWTHPTVLQALTDFNQNIDYIIQRQNSSLDTLICATMGVDKTLPNSYKLLKGSFEIFQKSHTQLEFSIEILFRILNQNGYNADKSLRTTSSGTHDISHAIYATAADWLLTTDTRFSAKCKAVFSFLGVPTKVVCCKPDYISETLDEIISDLNKSQDHP